ncbi:hypothetical protein [Bradyrhizobium sp. ORS 285]|uniref:hypothetical protein n=1 Tax=Bradyrhizobium sp. ORS 285 TaxID=115808 RepID=UPI000550CAD9|nr:hypothetical protein [Bradyrhizobium sp. ORS 285]
MRKMLIAAGPSEQPLRVMLPADDGASASDRRGRRAWALGRHRSARPSRAMKAILKGLRATLMVLMPQDLRRPADDFRAEVLPSSPALPELYLVRDCGRALDVASPAPRVPGTFAYEAVTPRHHLRQLRGRRRRP